MLSHILRELNEANAVVEPEVARSELLVRNSTLEVFLFWGCRGAQNRQTPCFLSTHLYFIFISIRLTADSKKKYYSLTWSAFNIKFCYDPYFCLIHTYGKLRIIPFFMM